MLESTFRSNHDGLDISYARCSVNNARAVLVIVHGMAEHKERYYHFMEFLAMHGIASFIEDHRGHGKSIRSAADLGYFGENGADGLLGDIKQLVDMARAEYPDVPLYMLGHSMGALAVRTFIQQHGDMLDGLIVSGNPGFTGAAKMGVDMARRVQRKKGPHARCRLLTLGMFAPFILGSRRFYSVNGWVCSDREVVRAYDADPLCGFEFQANGYEALLTLMLRSYDTNAPAPNKKLPVAFVSGANDACMGGKKGLEHAVGLLKAQGYNSVSSMIMDDMSHEILNEKDKQTVYDLMLQYLNKWIAIPRS